MNFRIRGLEAGQFSHLFALSEAELAAQGALRKIADGPCPCRVSLTDATPGIHLCPLLSKADISHWISVGPQSISINVSGLATISSGLRSAATPQRHATAPPSTISSEPSR